MTVTEYYNGVNKNMPLLINKTIITYEKDSVITKDTYKTVRNKEGMLYEYLYPG